MRIGSVVSRRTASMVGPNKGGNVVEALK